MLVVVADPVRLPVAVQLFEFREQVNDGLQSSDSSCELPAHLIDVDLVGCDV